MSGTKKAFGGFLVVVSLLGLVMSLVGVITVFRARKIMLRGSEQVVLFLNGSVETTEDSLDLVSDSLEQVEVVLSSVSETTISLDSTLENSTPMLSSMAESVGKDIPAVVYSTQQALRSFGNSAGVVDQFLRTLDSLSFLTGVNYDPAVPLDNSIESVSSNLGKLTPEFSKLEDSLNTAKDNFEDINLQIDKIDQSSNNIIVNINSAQTVVKEYQVLVHQQKENILEIQDHLIQWVNKLIFGILFVLGWIIILQVYLLQQGLEMAGSRRGSKTSSSEIYDYQDDYFDDSGEGFFY